MFRRIIKDGKLDLICQLIGGPADGTVVDEGTDMIRILQRRPLTVYQSIEDNSPFPKPVSIGYHRYKKISKEKYIYVGTDT